MVAEQLDGYLDRILPPITALAASKTLLERHAPDTIPMPLTKACRDFAHQVLDLLQVPIEESVSGFSSASARHVGQATIRPVALAA
jgi:hypothetical protein